MFTKTDSMKPFSFIIFLFLSITSFAGDKDSSMNDFIKEVKFMDSVIKAMKWTKGNVDLPNGISKLNVPAGFKYLGPEQSSFVLSNVWGNPPQEGVLGMIFPDSTDPYTDSSYAFVITYDPMGYVKDDDADKIDYDEMASEIRKDEVEENKQRKMQGYDPSYFIGWASKPYYDKEHKVLHWAKELKFGTDSSGNNTLNYEIRLLGRKGVLSMNAISRMSELPLVKQDINKVLGMASFTDGNAYKDFDSNVDNVAAWTIGGLVAGKVLAKAGILALILKNIKLVVLAIAAAGGGIWRFITGRKKNQDPVA